MTQIHNRPLLMWDGDCGFCSRCVDCLAAWSGGKVQYSSYQKQLAQYPDIPKSVFRKKVVLDDNGRYYYGAEAIYKVMALTGKWAWLYALYRSFPPFRWLSDWGYRIVAKNRGFFSKFFQTSCRI
ncbi:MAG: DUF393 domain-containing protein [Candidatus Margulisiibacteriota bacterium]